MEEKRKPTRWGLWLVVGLGLLVAYPLSVGPFLWLSASAYMRPINPYVGHLYRPLFVVMRNVPLLVKRPFFKYVQWWKDQLRDLK